MAPAVSITINMGERIGAYRVWVEVPEERILIRRPSLKWEDNINMYLKK
jgi:hypothetical protein